MKRKLKTTTTIHPYFTRAKRTKVALEILDLPTDVMILIFKLLTPSERRNAATVCQQWLDFVNRYFSKDHCIVLTWDLDYSTTDSLYQTFSNRLTIAKEKRTIWHMEIESFPDNISKLPLMGNFIRLIGDEVKSLSIKEYPDYLDTDATDFPFNANVFSNLPNLESLEVSSTFFLADLMSYTSLNSIRVFSSSCHVKDLENCLKVKSLETLTMSGLSISRKDLNNEPLLSILEPGMKELIEPYDDIILKAPTFNYCGKAKMAPNDINGIQILYRGNPLTQKILCGFGNLKRLKFCHSFDSPLILTNSRITYSGISKLTLNGLGSQPPPHLDKLFQSFPDLESLKIQIMRLRNEHFLLICKHLPQLKKLVLRGPLMEISAGTFFNEQYSLKDLPFLEKLEIHCDSQGNTVQCQWPPLPNLKELNLHGFAFRSFDTNFFSQMAEKSPKLTHITIDQIDYQSTFAKFLPLFQQLKLTHLSLPCVDNTLIFEESFTELVENLIEHCQELEEVTITGGAGFSLSQEVELFTNISSLTKITSSPSWIEEFAQDRVMKRKDVKYLKGYLLKNLAFYKYIRETVDYVAESIIAPNDFEEMNQSYQKNFLNQEHAEDLANFYIVTQNYLQMNNFNLSKLLYKIIGVF